jgi:hypothetical protein
MHMHMHMPMHMPMRMLMHMHTWSDARGLRRFLVENVEQ